MNEMFLEPKKAVRRTGMRAVFLSVLIMIVSLGAIAQTPSETPPPPADPPDLTLPDVTEQTLPNGLKVVVVKRSNVPLVTASLLVRKGASSDPKDKAGVASMTAELLTKGTAFKNATDIAQQIEFLGAGLNTNADWNGSSASVFVMKDKLGKALSLMSDSVIRPVFPEKEVALFKKQALDEFAVTLKQPGALLNFVAAAYTYGEHPTDGTPETVTRIKRTDLVSFHTQHYTPGNSVLVFAGDIDPETAFGYARLFFGGWTGNGSAKESTPEEIPTVSERPATVRRILVVNLPKSGQAAVGFANKLDAGRNESKSAYFSATVLNSVLGGGYSARLNQEIRLKRGLSYGARSGFSWRSYDSNFIAVAQTKNESAGQVAELMRIEIDKLIDDSISNDEMVPRKAVVTGGFGRSLQTNNGLANQLSELYAFGLSASELNTFTSGVKAVSASNIKSFAGDNLAGGDLIIVGDASMFLDDLKARFPDRKVEVIDSSKLNLNKSTLK